MRFVVLLTTLVVIFGCKISNTRVANESNLTWDQVGEFRFNSHSEITKDALLAANQQLKAGPYRAKIDAWTARLHSEGVFSDDLRLFSRMGREELNGGFFPERHLDDGTGRTQNRLQEGNIAADLPKRLDLAVTRFMFDAYCKASAENIGVPIDAATCKNLPNIGIGQPLHFTREFIETRDAQGNVTGVHLASALNSCRKSVKTIEGFTFKAQDAWRAGQEMLRQADAADDKAAPEIRKEAMKQFELMYLFLGVATHAIEDSFAPAHAQRTAGNLRQINDLCYYYDNNILPPSTAGACAHAVGAGREPRDSIYFASNEVPRHFAILTTTVFLRRFAEVSLNEAGAGSRDGLRDFLNRYFTAETGEGMGYFRCESLPAPR